MNMVKKDDNEPDMAHFNIRCSMKMRMDAENAAKEAGQSIAEWIRRAIQKELDARERDQSVKAGGVDDAGAIAAALLKALDDPVVAAEVKRRMDKIK